jgi:hypothetical protein
MTLFPEHHTGITKGDPLAAASAPRFGGRTYEPKKDGKRLSRQLDAVRALMLAGGKFTLRQLADAAQERTGRSASEAGVSARIRDLRKAEFGGYDVRRERLGDGGTFVYWINKETQG